MSEPDLDDASALQAQLKLDDDQDDAAFTTAQRQEIGSAISRLMGSTALVQVRTRHTGQNHFYMFDYLTEARWNVICCAETSHKQCQQEIIDQGLQIGLRYPKPMCIVQMNALIQQVQKKEYACTISYNQQQEFKDLWEKKRKKLPGLYTEKVFPPIKDFLLKYPHVYTAAEPPVPSRLKAEVINDAAADNPCRSSHKKLRNPAKAMERPSVGSQPAVAGGSLENQLLLGLTQMLLKGTGMQAQADADKHGQGKVSLPSTNGADTARAGLESPRASLRSPFGNAMEIDVEATPRESKSQIAIEIANDVDDDTRQPKTLDELSTAVDDALKRRKADGLKSDETIAKRRKAAALEVALAAHDGPAAAVPPRRFRITGKKPSGALYGKQPRLLGAAAPLTPTLSRPDRPATAKVPTAYKQGKIFFSAKKSKFGTFRVYRRVSDKVDKQIRIKEPGGPESEAIAWERCLDEIDNCQS